MEPLLNEKGKLAPETAILAVIINTTKDIAVRLPGIHQLALVGRYFLRELHFTGRTGAIYKRRAVVAAVKCPEHDVNAADINIRWREDSQRIPG